MLEPNNESNSPMNVPFRKSGNCLERHEALVFLHPETRPLGVRLRIAELRLADVLMRLRRRETPRPRRRTMGSITPGTTSAITRALSIPCHGWPPSILFLVFAELYAGIGHLFFCSLTIEMLVSGGPRHCPMEGKRSSRYGHVVSADFGFSPLTGCYLKAKATDDSLAARVSCCRTHLRRALVLKPNAILPRGAAYEIAPLPLEEYALVR